MATTNESRERLHIPRERPIPAGSKYLSMNYELGWLAAIVFTGVCMVVIGAAVGGGLAIAASVLFLMLGLAAWVCFIVLKPLESGQTSLLAMNYRNVTHWLQSKKGQNRHYSDQPIAGQAFGLAESSRPRPKPIRMIGRVDFKAHQKAGGVMGVTRDHAYDTYSSTIRIHGSSLLSESPDSMKERLGAWASLLDSLVETGSRIPTFSWHEQTLIGEHQRPEALVKSIRDGGQLTRINPPNSAVMLRRTAEMGRESVVHKTTLTLTVEAEQISRREAKFMGGREAVLAQRVDSFYSQVMGAERGFSPIGVKSARILSYNDLVIENRLALDPVFAQPLWQGEGWEAPASDHDLLNEQIAWPDYADFEPEDHCKLGQTYHMGFYIVELTRAGMMPDQFWDILKVPVPKTVSTVVQMVQTSLAQTQAEWTTTGTRGLSVDRLSKGRRPTEAQKVSAESALDFERQIAERRGQVGRLRCYIDVTGSSLEEVRANVKKMQDAWTGFTVQPLDNRQHLGIHAVMPIGRGLEFRALPKVLTSLVSK